MLNRGKVKGLLFVVSAPAGTGKSTLVNRLKIEFPNILQSVSYTTRAIRSEEIDGEDYIFISKEDFDKKINSGAFLEFASHFGNYYGTSKKTVDNILSKGKNVILVIDTQGAKSLQALEVPAVYIFITPPSIDELKRRLTKRATELGKEIQTRLDKVSEEIKSITVFDYCIENNDLEDAYQVLKAIVIAEEHRINLK